MTQEITRREATIMMTGLIGMLFARNLVASDKLNESGKLATGVCTTDELKAAPLKVGIVVVSLHHQNTLKLANAMAPVLGASVKNPQQVTIQELMHNDLIGFGSGIYDQKHHPDILRLVDAMPEMAGKKVFVFSTSGVSRKTCLKHSMDEPHTAIRNKLLSKGCSIVDEFNCVGWNTNSFLKLFGGINRSRPNVEDCGAAAQFAKSML